MIDGTLTFEVRGTVQIIEYSYDKMDNGTYLALLAVLRSKSAFTVVYLPDDSDTMISSKFICTTQPTPAFAFDVGGKAVWHNVSFVCREVTPHD